MLKHVDIQVIDLCRQVLYGKFDVVAGLVSKLYLKWSPLDTLAAVFTVIIIRDQLALTVVLSVFTLPH